MSDRAASRTAVLVCQGRAAADGLVAVGLFSDPVARHLLDPDELRVVDDVRTGVRPEGDAERVAWDMVRQTGMTMAPRTIAIDEALLAHDAPQVVILGAGLDARAWRMPELAGRTVYEVDHPASQADKRRRLGDRDRDPVARAVVWVPVDLSRDALGPALASAGHDPATPTTWLWEGVVPYLTRAEVEATLAALAGASAPGSRLVVNYQAKSFLNSAVRRLFQLVLALSRQPDPLRAEPWRSLWRPADLAHLLARHGFRITSDSDLATLAQGLDLPDANTLSLRNGRVAVADLPPPGG